MKRILLLGTLMLALLELGVLPALGETWYVDGARGNDNTPPADVHTGFTVAFRTIGQAVAAAVAGDIIYINGGTYPEYVYITKNLTLAGVGNVIIDGNSRYRNGFVIQYPSSSMIENITFQNCASGLYFASSPGSGLIQNVNNCIFRNCNVGVQIHNSISITIRNSVFYDNNSGYYASNYNYPSYAFFWNCTLADNSTAVSYSNETYGGNYVSFHFSIFANNGTGYYGARLPVKCLNNDFWQNTNANYPVLPTNNPSYEPNYQLDPQFVSRETRNYYLGTGSPLNELRIKDENGQLATIGALKSGFVSNNGVDNWAEWKDDQGASLVSSAKVMIVGEGVTLRSGVTEAAIVSKEYDSGNAAAKLVRVQYRGIEFEREAPGYRSFIDYNPATPEQEIRFRVGNTSGSLGAWQTTIANTPLNIAGRYYQIELVLRNMQ